MSKWKDHIRSFTNAAIIQGTLSNIPPEKWTDPYLRPNEKFDVYAFGILLWEMFTEKIAYKEYGGKAGKWGGGGYSFHDLGTLMLQRGIAIWFITNFFCEILTVILIHKCKINYIYIIGTNYKIVIVPLQKFYMLIYVNSITVSTHFNRSTVEPPTALLCLSLD